MLKRKKEIYYTYTPENKTKISKSLEENVALIKTMLKDCNDIVFREFEVGGDNGVKMFLFYVDGMADKLLLDEFVLIPLMIKSREVLPDFNAVKHKLFEVSKDNAMTVTDFKEVEIIEELVLNVLSGETGLLIDYTDRALVIATKAWPARSVAEPSAETIIRGPRDGFTETMRVNTALVRRRIRDPRFKIVQKKLGERSQTDIAIMYIEDIVDKRVLDELNKKLGKISIDTIMDSGYLEQLLEDKVFSIFPQAQTTERPDVVAAAVYEGRVGILVDNSPFALIVPVTINAFLQSAEDYYSRSIIATFVRFIRVLAGGLSILSPALYIAITSFHPQIIPSKLALSIAATREGVPFPAFIEAIIMEITFELLREAGIRLPRPIGSTIGIVGGLVIGQAAVSAGIVSPIMVIVVAITAIASFSITNYELATALRLLRFIFMIGASIYGLYGISLCYIGTLIYLVNLKSFGTPYLAPLAPLYLEDMVDSALKFPIKYIKKRPRMYDPQDIIRQGDENGSQ
ncbi:Spore germination protein B1 [Caloramator mitchellensis]|uniref:Spore germination protein B1 n=1 Tax=Caloramator mitchellensis TaxID=908809 RepID=A0A0R3JW23_CALMK|nr:spore germination protein [Caloramator mitchellensis]KRQ87776.1 Spore germination protein B1 [Caloramator mitchellensis]